MPAAQQGENMETRRFLGHWGQASGVPLQYDQAKCCSELLIKDRIWQRMANGFVPGKDFELPRNNGEQQSVEKVLLAPTATRTTTPKIIPRRTEQPQRLLLNTKSRMIHLMRPTGDGTVCPYVRNPQAAHFKQEKGRPEDYAEYQKCPRCHESMAGLIADVEWEIKEEAFGNLW